MKPILLIFLLLAAPAIAADTGSPPPAVDAAMDRARVAVEQAQAALRAAVDAQQAQAALLATQPVPPEAAAVVVQGPVEMSMPAKVQAYASSGGMALIAGMLGMGLYMMRSHTKFVQGLAKPAVAHVVAVPPGGTVPVVAGVTVQVPQHVIVPVATGTVPA